YINPTSKEQIVSSISKDLNIDSTLKEQIVSSISKDLNIDSTLKEQIISSISKDQNIDSTLKEQIVSSISKDQNIDSILKEQIISSNTKDQNIDPILREQILYEKKNNSELNILSESALHQEPKSISSKQMNLFDVSDSTAEAPFLSKRAQEEHRIIGQVFSTYWLVEYRKELYIIDQHAAHEKVLYERIMSASKNKTFVSQQLLPPIVLTLTLREQEILKKQEEVLNSLGYEFEHFGGHEYSVRAVPADLYSISEKELLLEFIDNLTDDFTGNASSSVSILERVASLSCKAAVKANHTFSVEEAQTLINELLTLENPYHCPHGRPVIISMSQYELERKFKRVI
ncbi:MAG: DNA mismatch repair protein MutL, partial [Mobilitalea sp.]